MKRLLKSIIVWLMICVIVTANLLLAEAKTVLTVNQTEEYINTISKQQMSTYPNPKFGTGGGEWTVMSLARYGSITEEYVNVYKNNLEATLKKYKGVLSDRKYTEYSRVVIALTAIGENAESFSGYNLVEPLFDLEKVKLQGLNGVAYALIAIGSGGYSNPKDEAGETITDRLVDEILQEQFSGGGWSLSGDNADTDLTAICIQALAPYMEDKKVKKAVNEGLEVLSKLQCDSGGFATMGTETCESTAQVLVAMTEAGVSIEDDRFVKSGKTVLDGLLAYYKGSGFSHLPGSGKNAVATDQATYALVSYYRSISGMNRLYDMSDGLVYKKIEDDVGEEIKTGIEEATKKQTVTNTEQKDIESAGNEQQIKEKNDKKTNSSGKKKNKTSEKKDDKKDINIEETDTTEESYSVSESESIEKEINTNDIDKETEGKLVDLEDSAEVNSKEEENEAETKNTLENETTKDTIEETGNKGKQIRLFSALLVIFTCAACGFGIWKKNRLLNRGKSAYERIDTNHEG